MTPITMPAMAPPLRPLDLEVEALVSEDMLSTVAVVLGLALSVTLVGRLTASTPEEMAVEEVMAAKSSADTVPSVSSCTWVAICSKRRRRSVS